MKKTLKNLYIENQQEPYEITSGKPPERFDMREITYKGRPFFDEYMDLIDKAAKKLRTEGGDQIEEYQECYLGYIPSKDKFIMGFDIWVDEPDYLRGTYVLIDADNEKFKTLDWSEKLFYQGLYNEIHRSYPDLVDIRLD